VNYIKGNNRHELSYVHFSSADQDIHYCMRPYGDCGGMLVEREGKSGSSAIFLKSNEL